LNFSSAILAAVGPDVAFEAAPAVLSGFLPLGRREIPLVGLDVNRVGPQPLLACKMPVTPNVK
jgi:hypothetical protein